MFCHLDASYLLSGQEQSVLPTYPELFSAKGRGQGHWKQIILSFNPGSTVYQMNSLWKVAYLFGECVKRR